MKLNIINHDPALQVVGLDVVFAPAMIQVKHGMVVRDKRMARCLTQHMRLDVANQDRQLACYILDNGHIQLSIGTGGNPPKPPSTLFYKLFYGTIPAGGSITQGEFTVKGKAKSSKTEEPKPTDPLKEVETPKVPKDSKEETIFKAIAACEKAGDVTSVGLPSVSALNELLHDKIDDTINSGFRDEWFAKYQAAKLK
jgi:hypothetical protein